MQFALAQTLQNIKKTQENTAQAQQQAQDTQSSEVIEEVPQVELSQSSQMQITKEDFEEQTAQLQEFSEISEEQPPSETEEVPSTQDLNGEITEIAEHPQPSQEEKTEPQGIPEEQPQTVLQEEDLYDLQAIKAGELFNLPAENIEQAYTELLEYLRVGAYWNDLPANTVVDFIAAYLQYNDVPDYEKNGKEKGTYDNFEEIGEHLKQTLDSMFNGERGMVRISHNGSGSGIHSMLTLNPDKKNYVTQTLQKEMTLQWLEAAYKYVQGEPITDGQKKMLVFTDPYGQGASSTFPGIGYADMFLTEKRLKTRALGMICHTIEDAYNPAHTVRMYPQNATTISDYKILAFGNYEGQSHDFHKSYDAISPLDEGVRKQLRDGTKTYAGAVRYPDISTNTAGFKTMSLELAYESIVKLFDFYAKGATWSEIEPWLRNDIYATNFNSSGDSYVFEAGRKTTNFEPILDTTWKLEKGLRSVYKNKNTKVWDDINAVKSNSLNNIKFFAKEAKGGRTYHTPYDTAGYNSIKAFFDKLKTTVIDGSEAEVNQLIKKLGPVKAIQVVALIKDLNGILQEYAIDLEGGVNKTYDDYANTAQLLHYRTSTESQTPTVLVGEVLGSGNGNVALRLDDGETVSVILQEQMEIGSKIKVTCEIISDGLPGSMIKYFATAAEKLNSTNNYSMTGKVTAITDTTITIVSDLSGTYKLTTPTKTDSTFLNNRVIVWYQVGANGVLTLRNISHSLEKITAENMEGEIELASLPYSTKTVGIVDVYADGIKIAELDTLEEGGDVYANELLSEVVILDDAMITGFLTNESPNGDKHNYPLAEIVYLPVTEEGESSVEVLLGLRMQNHIHDLTFATNNNGTHTEFCKQADLSTVANCTYENNVCIYCGYKLTSTLALTATTPKVSPKTADTKEIDFALLLLFCASVTTVFAIRVYRKKVKE